VRAIAPRVRAF